MDIHLLDVGTKKYGDCIVVRQGNKSILIDGAHPGDDELITEQLQAIFGGAGPFRFNLLVVTHCHLDHIGSLPSLIEDGVITFEKALVADEKLGWGRRADEDSADNSRPSNARTLALALQEEPLDDAPDEEVREFLEDVATLESKYKTMIESLMDAGTEVVRYGRDPDARVQAIESEFSNIGMKILGPTRAHLVQCAEFIRDSTTDAVDEFAASDAGESGNALISAYRQAVTRVSRAGLADSADAALEDRPGGGSGEERPEHRSQVFVPI